MSYFMVDIEADGPIPGDYSMIAVGAVKVEDGLSQSFLAYLKPISEQWSPPALAISGFSREETLNFSGPEQVMTDFEDWLHQHNKGQMVFISDNNGFDWMFVCWYFHHFLGRNPFGHSSQNLGSLYKGMVKDSFQSFKHLRQTAHTHNPLDDARGNAEALLALKTQGLKLSLK